MNLTTKAQEQYPVYVQPYDFLMMIEGRPRHYEARISERRPIYVNGLAPSDPIVCLHLPLYFPLISHASARKVTRSRKSLFMLMPIDLRSRFYDQ